LPLSRCKACHLRKKKYAAYYNAAAHLRRVHFRPKKLKRHKGDNGKNFERRGADDWPPMSELKFWMKEVEAQLIDDQALRDSSEDLDDNDDDSGDLQGEEAFEGSNFGTPFDPSLNQMPMDATILDPAAFPTQPFESMTEFGGGLAGNETLFGGAHWEYH